MNLCALLLCLHLPRWVTYVNAEGDESFHHSLRGKTANLFDPSYSTVPIDFKNTTEVHNNINNIAQAKGGKSKSGKPKNRNSKSGKSKSGKAKSGKAKSGKTKNSKKKPKVKKTKRPTNRPTNDPTNHPTLSPTQAPSAAPSESSGLAPTTNVDTYYYTRVLKNDQEDVIFNKGPIRITSHCTGSNVYMKLKVNHTLEDMLVFGSINDDDYLDDSPIGDNSKGVLDTGVTYEKTMWSVTSAGNNLDYGAVAIKTLTSNETYYVGWDGESFVGIANENSLVGGYDCALAGVFRYSFPDPVKSTILNVNSVGPVPEDGPDTYYYTKVLIDGQEDVIFNNGPISITSHCTGNETYMQLKLNNTVEDMLVFGDIRGDTDLNSYPIGNSSEGVLDAGDIYEETMWSVYEGGNDIDDGAVAIKTLNVQYYVGWDGESSVGIANENGLAGGYNCALTGVFHYSFPPVSEKSEILKANPGGPALEDGPNTYYYTRGLNDGQEDVIFDEGPIKITSYCTGNQTYMKVKLNNTAEDMLAYGSISGDQDLVDSPIGDSSVGVLDAGVIYEETMWIVYEAGNDYDHGAVVIKTLTSNHTYYVGWDGESLVGIADEDGLTGGYDCVLAGVFHYSFPVETSTHPTISPSTSPTLPDNTAAPIILPPTTAPIALPATVAPVTGSPTASPSAAPIGTPTASPSAAPNAVPNNVNTYYYTEVSNHGQEGKIVFNVGPITITSYCDENGVNMWLKLKNTAEDMLMFGDISDDWDLNKSPIGDRSKGVLVTGATYEKTMWSVYEGGNDYGHGAVAIMTLTSNETYYVGWDGASFVGIANENGLAGGYDCALAGVFHYSFPPISEKSTILNVNSVGPAPEDGSNSYYYTKGLNDSQEDVIFDEGPIRITSHCTGNHVYMKLKLNNTAEGMLVFGSITNDVSLNSSPIGDGLGGSSVGVLDAGDIYEETMWSVYKVGNDRFSGAVTIKTLTSNQTYYVGWDGESFVGIANENGLAGGYECALAGVFHYSFPPISEKSTILNMNSVGPSPEDGPNTYYYTRGLNDGRGVDVVFDEGPIKITSYCIGDRVYMKLKLNNTVEDMFVFGSIRHDSHLDNSPIGNSSEGVLDAGDIYEEWMLRVDGAGNKSGFGAVTIKTLTSNQTYYVGWDGESFVGIGSYDGLADGYDCAIAGVFHYSFPV